MARKTTGNRPDTQDPFQNPVLAEFDRPKNRSTTSSAASRNLTEMSINPFINNLGEFSLFIPEGLTQDRRAELGVTIEECFRARGNPVEFCKSDNESIGFRIIAGDMNTRHTGGGISYNRQEIHDIAAAIMYAGIKLAENRGAEKE